MSFNSLAFLIFFVVFFALYWTLSGRARLWLCLIGSYFFYGWWKWYLLSLIILSTGIDYVIGLMLGKTESESRRKWLVALSVVSNLSILAVFKYFNFFAESLAALASRFDITLGWTTLNIVLPVGISFYTFQSLSYTVDVYRKKIPFEPDLLKFATFVAFFPQLVAGPIVRASVFLPQLQSDRTYRWENVVDGFGQVLLGFFKKLVIADTLALVVDPMFDFPDGYSAINVIILAVLFSFQVYGDFAGYSDIAIGSARMLGFKLPVNFNFPFFASSLADFWRRWHITLSTWLRDYLYFPLGGSRGSKWMTRRNLFITMALAGLWHGAAWTYVVWGALFGLAMLIERELIQRFPFKSNSLLLCGLVRAAQAAFVVGFLSASLIIFRSENLAEAGTLFGQIASLDSFSPSSLHNRILLFKAMALTCLLVAGEFVFQFIPARTVFELVPATRPIVYAVLLWAIALFGTFGSNAFVYFQF